MLNGQEAHELQPNFAAWEAVLEIGTSHGSSPIMLTAYAKDAAGNVEKRPHEVTFPQ
jgi:hypothetical protein